MSKGHSGVLKVPTKTIPGSQREGAHRLVRLHWMRGFLSVGEPPLDGFKWLPDRSGDLSQALTLSAKSLGLSHLRAKAPFLFPEPARHRAILRLISARREERTTALALENRPTVGQILHEHVREAGEQRGSYAARLQRSVFIKIQDRVNGSPKHVDHIKCLLAREFQVTLDLGLLAAQVRDCPEEQFGRFAEIE